MPTTPINGLPSPDSTSPNNPPIHFDALNAVLDSRLVGRYASVAARNSAITAPVNGMLVYVTGLGHMYYHANAWRALYGPDPVHLFGTALARSDAVLDSWFSATVPDPGYPYRLYVNAAIRTFAASCTVDVRLQIGAAGGADSSLPVVTSASNFSNSLGLDIVLPERPSGVLTGNGRIVGFAVRSGGTGNYSIPANASVLYRVVPA